MNVNFYKNHYELNDLKIIFDIFQSSVDINFLLLKMCPLWPGKAPQVSPSPFPVT